MAYKIYFLGGDLSQAERSHFYEPYRSRLSRLIPERAGAAQIVFEPLDKCSRARLVSILTDATTVGVFWLSHGTGSGGLRTKEADADDAPSLYVNPIGLGQELQEAGRKISPNLQFLALLSCYSHSYRREWQQLLPKGTKIKDSEGPLFAASGLPIRDAVTRWIDNPSPERPEWGARGLLAYAKQRLSVKKEPTTALSAPTRSMSKPTTTLDWRWVKGKKGRWQMQLTPPRRPPSPVRLPRPAIAKPLQHTPLRPPPATGPQPGSPLSRLVRPTPSPAFPGTGPRKVDFGLGDLRRRREQEEWRRRAAGRLTVRADRRPTRPLLIPPRTTGRLLTLEQPGYFVRRLPGGGRRIEYVQPSVDRWWSGPRPR